MPPKRAKAEAAAKPAAAEVSKSAKASKPATDTKPRHLESGTTDALDQLLEPFYDGKHLSDPIDTARDKWNLLPAFLKVKGLIKQHIDSFDYFVETELKSILKANAIIRSDVDHKFWLKYTDIRVGRPNRSDEDSSQGIEHESDVTPNECRLRDLTYAAPIYVDFDYHWNGRVLRHKNRRIGRLPIMLRSGRCILNGQKERKLANLGECAVDPGGYFIVKGQEKVILVQEQLSKNRVIVESLKGVVQASVTSSTHERKSKSYVICKKGRIYFRHNILAEDCPIVILFKAMGVVTDNEITRIIAGNDNLFQDEMAINIEESMQLGVHSTLDALEWIGARLKFRQNPMMNTRINRNPPQEALEALASVMISHIPADGLNFTSKILFVAFMVRRVLMATYNEKLVDDRDYVGNKRLELAGQMLSLLFEDHFKRFNHDFRNSIDGVLRKPVRTTPFDAYEQFRRHTGAITHGVERAIATGNWNLKRFKMERAGVTHVLSRLSYISALGMMTRIQSQFEKTRKVSGPRALQTSQFGMLCTSDTPEGEACGLVKNLALMTHITSNDSEDAIRDLISVLGVYQVSAAGGFEIYEPGSYIIFLNGTPIALTKQAKAFLHAFRKFRRGGRISEFVSIHINDDHRAVHIASDEGRICRPLIIVENGKSKVTKRHLAKLRKGELGFDDMLRLGVVEYLDVNEENDSNIAVYDHDVVAYTTHLEIEPFTILGVVAGLIPYPHHNQSPRNTYQCAMGKQAIGAIAYNQFTRIDTLLYLMVYPQKPLVKTRTIELVKYDKLPAGQNAMVAVMSYSGYDIEDALVLNKASIDRGFGRCQVFRKAGAVLKSNGSPAESLAQPSADKPAHSKLHTDGLIEPAMKLEQGDVYISKLVPTGGGDSSSVLGSGSGYTPKIVDSTYRLPDPSIVDKVMITTNEQEFTVIKLSTRQTRRPEVGDKFSSRHGQKGVVGIIVEQEDLPFADSGIVPDIIMNPHGFPSRMTVGKMLELVSGKAGINRGTFEYGTAFGGSKVEEMGAALVDRGFSYTGKDYLTCGTTGEAMPAFVFFGPIYYQKLKHMVQDKMHSRSTGPKATLTRQPTEGRSRGGGLRLGEMERDCLIAYGASQLLLERLMLSSDQHRCEICQACGMMGYKGYCQSCNSSKGMVEMVIPYAAKLLIQELLSMNIKATLATSETFE